MYWYFYTGGNVVRGDQKLCKQSPYRSFRTRVMGAKQTSKTGNVSDFNAYFNVCILIF